MSTKLLGKENALPLSCYSNKRKVIYNSVENSKPPTHKESSKLLSKISLSPKNIPYLCSIEPLKLVKSGQLKAGDNDYEVLIGNSIRQRPTVHGFPETQEKIIDRAWNSSFTTVFKSRDTLFFFISNTHELARYITSASTFIGKQHLIFNNCNQMVLFSAAKNMCIPDDDSPPPEISSISFVDCCFGDISDSDVLMKTFLSIPSLEAISIVDCDINDDVFCSDDWNMSFRRQITRVELGTCCETVGLLKLFSIFQGASALSHRPLHVCSRLGQKQCNHSKLKIATKEMIQDLQKRISSVEELEFDMDSLSLLQFKTFFQLLSTQKRLSSIAFNRSDFCREAEFVYKEFFLNVKSLRVVDIRSGSYFPSDCDKPTILTLLGASESTIVHLSLRDLHPTDPHHRLKLKKELSMFKHLEILSIEDCDIDDAELSIHDNLPYRSSVRGIFKPKFRYVHQRLNTLEIRGLRELGWDFIDRVTLDAPYLVKLDLSGFTRWAPSDFEFRQPLDYIFMRLRQLKILILNDLEIDDDNLFGKVYCETATSIINEGDEGLLVTSLLNLKDLEYISLQNTEVSNVSLRCVARFMPRVVRINVSFTLINHRGLEYAHTVNPQLQIQAIGCSIPKSPQSECNSFSYES